MYNNQPNEMVFRDTRVQQRSVEEDNFYHVCCFIKQRLLAILGIVAIITLYCTNAFYDPMLGGKNGIVALIGIPMCLLFLFAPTLVEIRFLPVRRWYRNMIKI